MAILAALGFASGLPLYLTSLTLTAWLTDEHVDATKIGLFSLVGLPYTFKFAWAPLLDRYRLPFLGRRRGWMLAAQLCLVVAIAAMGAADPGTQSWTMAGLALVVAFLSATQDVVLDAYSTDLLSEQQRAAGSAVYVLGYRAAMLTTGTLALVLADHVSWRVVYEAMALFMLVGVVATLLAEEPAASHAVRPRTLAEALTLPFARFFRRFGVRAALCALAFAATYRFGDYLLDTQKMKFFLGELGFQKTEFAALNKAFSFAAVVVGGATVGVLAPRLGVRRALLVFGVLQASTNLFYLLLAQTGRSIALLGVAIFCDNFASTMGAAVMVAFLMSLCDREVSATQFALLSSLSSVGARVFGWTGGLLVTHVGFEGFFLATALLALPGLLLARFVVLPADAAAPLAREVAKPAPL
jgi:PAT family beta-lactamase induction signal transducer AmpG